MRKKWLKKMAAILSAALLLSAPDLPVMADYVSEDGQEVMEDGGMEAAESAAEMVRSVSGGDTDIIYPAPRAEWLDNWTLQIELPEGADEAAGHLMFGMAQNGEAVHSWHSQSTYGGKATIEVSRMLGEGGLYSFEAYFSGGDGRQISEKVTVEREYAAPSEKLGTTTAIWYDGSIPRISFAAVPHADWYEVVCYYKGGCSSIGSSFWYANENGTIWLREDDMIWFLSESGEEDNRVGRAGEYTVTVQAFSEDVTLYANGDMGPMSEPFAFDGVFGKISTSDISKVKEGLSNEKVTEIEYKLPDGAEVSGADQAEIFSALKGTDKSLTFSFRSENQSTEYQWTFDGAEIADDTRTMNFQIIVDAGVQEVIDCVDTSRLSEVDLAFLHEGELPGRATVTVNLRGKLGDARTANLYYYNPETKQLEVVAENLAIEGGCVAFPMSHCSNYILTAEMLKNLIPDKEPEKPDAKPGTSDNADHNAASVTVSVQSEVIAEPVGESVVSYVVQPGDTLKKIAAKFYGSRELWTKIYADNAGIISNPDRIYAGQVIYIYLTDNPVEANENTAGNIYIVQKGDSLWKIAKTLYGKGKLYPKIYEANKAVISNPKNLYVGQKIVIPE